MKKKLSNDEPPYIKHYREQRDLYYNKGTESERTLDTTVITAVTIMLTVSGTFISSVEKKYLYISLIISAWICFVLTILLVVINMRLQSNVYDNIVNEADKVVEEYEKNDTLIDANYPKGKSINIINNFVIALTILGAILLTIFYLLNVGEQQ